MAYLLIPLSLSPSAHPHGPHEPNILKCFLIKAESHSKQMAWAGLSNYCQVNHGPCRPWLKWVAGSVVLSKKLSISARNCMTWARLTCWGHILDQCEIFKDFVMRSKTVLSTPLTSIPQSLTLSSCPIFLFVHLTGVRLINTVLIPIQRFECRGMKGLFGKLKMFNLVLNKTFTVLWLFRGFVGKILWV